MTEKLGIEVNYHVVNLEEANHYAESITRTDR